MGRETFTQKQKRCLEILSILHREFPNPVIALNHQNPFELLIATILSAQCTDERVNKVTPFLFKAAPTPERLAKLGQKKIEELIKSVNFFRNKSRNIAACATDLVRHFNSEVPQTLDELTSLPGVGRKTANVVLGSAFNTPGMVVDTHVLRISNRLGFAKEMSPVRMEAELEKIVPRAEWVVYSHLVILHGRKTCKALKPLCRKCVLADHCPSADKAADAWKF